MPEGKQSSAYTVQSKIKIMFEDFVVLEDKTFMRKLTFS